MKKYLLFLTSFVLLILGLTSFMKVVKSKPFGSKKVSFEANHSSKSVLNRQLLFSAFEKENQQKTNKLSQADREQLLQTISELPLMFEKNMGQWREEVLYRASDRTNSVQIGFRKNGLTFCSSREVEEDHHDLKHEEEKDEEEVYERMIWNLNFKGMNSQTEIVAEGEVAGVTNYLLGNDSTKWAKNTPESKVIKYKGIYDHIDLYYYGLANHKLEYDYIVKPGGVIANIQMVLEGAGGLSLNQKGELIITTPWGKVGEDKPYSYQFIDGVKKEIDIRYEILNDSTFGFKAYGSYNTNYELIIDPKVLVWSTYVNGKNSGGDYYCYDMGIDASGNSYMTGMTPNNFDIVAGAKQTAFGGGVTDAYVFKISRLGRQLLYCTYVGGSGDERGFGIAVNAAGNAFITGQTSSTNYPTQAAMYGANQGGLDVFITALLPNGTGFLYSTYFGGASDDRGEGIFVNAAGEAYVTGYGSDVPTTAGVIRTAAVASGRDAIVLKLTAAGGNAFCTQLGVNSVAEEGKGITVSGTGEIYVTGFTPAASFPAGGFDASYNGGDDAFVAKINIDATAIVYSTYLGGAGEDVGWGIDVRNDEAYVIGITTGGFPTTAGAVQTTYGGGVHDFFVTKLNVAGTAQVYSTYVGGAGDEYGSNGDWNGSDIAVNNNGQAYISGTTGSAGLVTKYTGVGYDQFFDGGSDPADGYIALIAANGASIMCATYMGGLSNDYKKISIALDLSNPNMDTLYGSLTTHSRSTLNATAGTMPIAQLQGSVYSPTHYDDGGGDEPFVFKMYSCMVPLPVELISFKAWNKGDHNLLEWTTATEKNNDYFSIERSTDGVNFLVVGMVDGAGNSSSVLNYSYSDQKEGDEITYYRLKQTDENGQINYSEVVAVNDPHSKKALELTILSPVTDHLNYKVCCLQKGDAKVEVFDLSGKIVITANTHVHEGNNSLTLDTKTLPSGLYILKFTADNGTAKAKFVK
jgi:hypothetical protein